MAENNNAPTDKNTAANTGNFRREVSPEMDHVYAYFQNIRELFQDDLKEFERHWRNIQNYDFNAQQLREILQNSVSFLSGYPRTRNQDIALNFIKTNISCWRSKALERINEADFRALLSYNKDLQRLDVTFSQGFTRIWLRRFFELLPLQGTNSFAYGLMHLGQFKRAYLPKETPRLNRMNTLFSNIEKHVENMDALQLRHTMHGLDCLDILPNKDLRGKIIERAIAILKTQSESQAKGQKRNNAQFGQDSIMQTFVSAGNLGFDLPKDFLKFWEELAPDLLKIPEPSSKTYNIGLVRHAKIVHACAIHYTLTGNKQYRDLARQFYTELKPHVDQLRDIEKRMVFDACLFFKYPESHNHKLAETEIDFDEDFACDIIRPASDNRASLNEDDIRLYLESLEGVDLAPEQLIIDQINHRVDLNILFNGEAVGIEFDGPDHFLSYYDHSASDAQKRRIYKPKDIYRARLNEKLAPDTTIIKLPYSADNLANKQPVPSQEPEQKKEVYFRRVLGKAARAECGVYLIRAQFRKGALLKPIKPNHEGGAARRYEELGF